MPRGKARGRGAQATRGRKSALSTISTADLQRELQRRESLLGEMMHRHAELQQAMAMLESEIGVLGPASAGRGGGRDTSLRGRGRGRGAGARAGFAKRGSGSSRPRGLQTRNTMSLPEYLVKVLTNTTLGVSEAAEAVKRAGYQTNSPNFRTMVNQALLANKTRFKKIARGQYTAK